MNENEMNIAIQCLEANIDSLNLSIACDETEGSQTQDLDYKKSFINCLNQSKDILKQLYSQLNSLQKQTQKQLTGCQIYLTLFHNCFYIIERQYFVVTAQILSAKKYPEYRRIMFQEAQHFSAFYDIRNREQSIWYPENSKDLHISLMFASKSDAHRFIGQMANFQFYKKFRGGINFQTELTVLNIHINDNCESVLITDYDPTTNFSPDNSSDNSIHSSEATINNDDPEKRLRAVEDFSQLKYKERIDKCHIASQVHYNEYKNDPNNILYASHLFHGYFGGDGRKPPPGADPEWGTPPELALKFIEVGPTQTVDRQQYTKIIVHVIFRDIEGTRAMDGRWREGSEIMDEFTICTHFYTKDVEATVKYLKIKYFETEKRWRHCECEEVDFNEVWDESRESI